MRKLTPKSVCRQADSLLTPIIKLKYPNCLLQAPSCTKYTQVAHHHVHKSKSTRLRHEIDNLIPLCNSCHLALHWNESYYASKIVSMRGLEWFNLLEKKKNEIVKADILYYSQQLGKLRTIYANLEQGRTSATTPIRATKRTTKIA